MIDYMEYTITLAAQGKTKKRETRKLKFLTLHSAGTTRKKCKTTP